MNITKSLHTGILVTDLEKAVNFYENVLGLTRIDRPFQYDGVWYQVGDYQIHLIVDTNYQNYRPNPQKWGRNPHIAFAIDADRGTSELENLPTQASGFSR